jgi:hypothetical protein
VNSRETIGVIVFVVVKMAIMDVVISVDIGCVMMVVLNSLNIKSMHVGDKCSALVILFNVVVLAYVVFVNNMHIIHGHVRWHVLSWQQHLVLVLGGTPVMIVSGQIMVVQSIQDLLVSRGTL